MREVANGEWIIDNSQLSILNYQFSIYTPNQNSHRNRSIIRDELEKHLRFEPDKVSQSRIKRLRGIRHPQYRLRVGETRIFYDIVEDMVEVLAIVRKSDAVAWLAEMGEVE